MSAVRPVPAMEEGQAATVEKDLLRCVVCGPDDTGKSTLVAHMLSSGTPSRDGLSSEPQQNVAVNATIRSFETGRRKFVVADAADDEQYLRNMALDASRPDVAIILVDARNGVLRDTHRHAGIAQLLGIRHVVLAVNKMDLLDWWQECFGIIENDFIAFAESLDIEHIACVPVSAATGANISKRGAEMPWYEGPTVMEYLDAIEIDRHATGEFRLPISRADCLDSGSTGYSGTISGGHLSVGDRIAALPSRKEARIARLVTDTGDLTTATAGEAVTFALDPAIDDLAIGDVLVSADDHSMEVSDQLQAHIVWVGKDALIPGRQYSVRVGSCTVAATVTEIKYKLDLATQVHLASKTLAMNDVGVAVVSLDRPLPFDAYAKNRATGSFILVDRYSNATVATGMIDHGMRRATNVVWHETSVNKAVRAGLKAQRPACLWFTGLSGSGKSTVANLVDKRLTAEHCHTYVLDGDNVRHGLNSDLGFTEADRVENIRRIAEVAKLMVDAGLIVLVCAISPYRKDRDMARQCFEEGEFIEVFVDTPLAECEARDPKGLYKKARQGQIPNFTGISAPYEAPAAPEVHLNGVLPPEQLAEQVFERSRHMPGTGK